MIDKSTDQLIRICTLMDADTLDRLEAYARTQDRSRGYIIRRACAELLRRSDRKATPPGHPRSDRKITTRANGHHEGE